MSLDIKSLVKDQELIILTDDKVNSLYGHLFKDSNVIIVPQGEKNKDLATVSNIYQRLLELGADRSFFLLGVGGGLVLDITGFTASTFMRGLSFGYVPTTLLAQADAAYGGKNGVNLNGIKNVIGLIKKPEFVYSDPEFLKTLDPRELRSGFAEIIKTSLVMDKDLFHYLEIERERIIKLEREVLEHVIKRTVKAKMDIVSADEFELGERKKLNLGHTIGHALEYLSKGALSHGEAVAQGVMFSALLSVKLGLLQAKDAERIDQLFTLYGIKVGTELSKYSTSSVMDCIFKDKKKKGTSVDFVLLDAIGRAVLRPLSFNELEGYIDDLR